MPYIYKIINSVNGKLYIGKTSHNTIQERLLEHIEDSQKTNIKNRPLYNAFRKYGVNNFSIELIEEVANDVIACEREAYWIDKLRTYVKFHDSNGYNATLGGDGRRLYDYKLLAQEYLNLGTIKAVCKKYDCDEKPVQQACHEYGIQIKIAPNQQKIQRIDKFGNIVEYNSITEAARDIPNKDVETARKNISRALNSGKIGYGYKWKRI